MPIWTIGRQSNGRMVIGGPWEDMEDANESTSNLHDVRKVRLATNNRAEARRQIERLAKNMHQRKEQQTEPDLPRKRSIISRILRRDTQTTEVEEID